MSDPRNITTIQCPDPTCHRQVDEAFYPQHIESGHKLHVINIRGMGSPEIVQPNPKGPIMVQIPYLGRLRRDAFLAWTFVAFLGGIVFAGWYWHII